jgi:hypothetical protein
MENLQYDSVESVYAECVYEEGEEEEDVDWGQGGADAWALGAGR